MTFTGRMRLTLVLAAIFPTALISIIVLVGLSQQVKRIENRDAEAACVRFTELLDNASGRIQKDLQYIVDSRQFQVMEWGIDVKHPPDPKYKLPLLSLDFVEYIDPEGRVLISANRPGMVGQKIDMAAGVSSTNIARLVFENDLHGSHPSISLIMPTENGFVRGGTFLDGVFSNLASAVTRSTLEFVDIRTEAISELPVSEPSAVGIPYRSENRLNAVLAYDSLGEYYPQARFQAYEQRSLFADFFTAVAVVTVFSLLLVVPAGLYFSARTRREFDTLTGGALRVAAGDFSRPVVTSGEGEFSDLADSFNRMMGQLTDYREKLIVSQKIAAWQTIGRKIAHEVRNPLTPITIAVDDLRHSYHDRSEDYEKILEDCTIAIKGEVDRLKRLLDQFSSFAKMPPPEFSSIIAGTFIRDIPVLFKDEIAHGRLAIENEIGETTLHIDPEQMRQVIINLVKNSMEAGCRLCTLKLTTDENRFQLMIDDDGPGIPARILDEGPTPYFSTKEHGSGLGLIICQRIVLDHDGTMTIDNKPDGGARVIIALPMKYGQDTSRRR